MENPKAIGEALDSICDIVERLDRERDSLKEVIGSMQNEILTLRDALEKMADIELKDNGDPWSSLEAIGAIAHNAIHHPQNV